MPKGYATQITPYLVELRLKELEREGGESWTSSSSSSSSSSESPSSGSSHSR